jgi:hypothetical protein
LIVPFGQDAGQMQLAAAHQELDSCNQVTQRYGLSLSSHDIQTLVTGRLEALRTADRVEFGGGIAKELVLGFCSSPYVSQRTFVQTVLELQELFYQFKNESLEQVPDDELIETMRSLYDDVAHGDMEYVAEALFDGLGRHIREEVLDADVASLAARRSSVADWTDETYAPAWEGASWVDE